MKILATTAGRHLFGNDLYVQGRLEIQWEPGGQWLKMSAENYGIGEWQLTILVFGIAAKCGAFDFEHVDMDDVHTGGR